MSYADELCRFIYGCHITALQLLKRDGVTIVLTDVKDVEQLHIKAPPGTAEGSNMPMASTPLPIVVSTATLRKRLQGRAVRQGEWRSDEKRLESYFRDKGVRNASLPRTSATRR